jgi:hypothetical protein
MDSGRLQRKWYVSGQSDKHHSLHSNFEFKQMHLEFSPQS